MKRSAEIPGMIDLVIDASKNCMDSLGGGQDSLMRFVFCCAQKMFKSFTAVKHLYKLTASDPAIEFSLGVILRTLLMDAVMVQYLKFLTVSYNGLNGDKIKGSLMDESYRFIADGTSFIIDSIYSNTNITEAERNQTIQNIVNQFPGVFNIDTESGRYKMDKKFRVSLADLFKASDHPDIQIRKQVYDLYCFYSKYDHVSHWTSIAANLEEGYRLHHLDGAIIMVALDLRDLLRVALFHDQMYTWCSALIIELDIRIEKNNEQRSMITWNNIQDLNPGPQKVVIVSKEAEANLSNADIGRLVCSDDGREGWFIGNQSKIVKLSARNYWLFLEEDGTAMPDFSMDEEYIPTTAKAAEVLTLFEGKFILLAKHMFAAGNGLYPLDYFIAGIIKRSLSLTYGFGTLLQTENYLTAAHLVRLHLDNYLRLFASGLVSDPHQFAVEVMTGKPVKNMKDKGNKAMTDRYLMEKASEILPWIANVYKESSGFIHFSNKHIWDATSVSKTKEMTLDTYIGKTDHNVSHADRAEAALCMIEISNCIAMAIYSWIETKRIRG